MKIDDYVFVLDGEESGLVVAINKDLVTVLTTDDFEMQFNKNELVIVDGSISETDLIPKNISNILSEKKSEKKKNSIRIKSKMRIQPPMVVDLHIHQLVPNQKGMSNYDMLTIQTDTAKRQLDFAIRNKIQKIVFIHGVGEGVLREELEYLFRRYDDTIKYYDADYQKYGRGATEVYIFQNKK
jgi:transcriptional regulator with PAS, ATPase and Fis domain